MFSKRLTKWIPLGQFTHDDCDYIVFVRGSKKTGMLYFKTKRLNIKWGWFFPQSILTTKIIDISTQWNEILNQVNSN